MFTGGPWRNPIQQGRVNTFKRVVVWLRFLGLPPTPGSLRRAVELELAVHGGLLADSQVALDQALLRA